MATVFGMCTACLRLRGLTRHHVFTKRFNKKEKAVCYLCRECHDEIELQIPVTKKKVKGWYLKTLLLFILERRKECQG